MSAEKKSMWTPPTSEEVVKRLMNDQDGVIWFNALRVEHPDWEPDLSGQNFENANLGGIDLNHVNLSGASFSRANLSTSRFMDADCLETEFFKADLTAVNFGGAKLYFADFTDAVTWEVNWWCANITGAKGLRRTTVDLVLATIRDSVEFAD